MAYAGFQFGTWVPQLGDGRAILLGELIDRDGVRRDIQLKGAGPGQEAYALYAAEVVAHLAKVGGKPVIGGQHSANRRSK